MSYLPVIAPACIFLIAAAFTAASWRKSSRFLERDRREWQKAALRHAMEASQDQGGSDGGQ